MVDPGHMKAEELWNINITRLERYMRMFLPFLTINKDSTYIDMGDANPKMEIIKKTFNIDVEQVTGVDFNFAKLTKYYNSVDGIFALEILEHVQNPLWFMNEMKLCLKDNGSIYVTIPSNAKWLWIDGHYFEIPKNHFEKWIVRPLGLEIVKYKRIYFVWDWKAIFIGYRPLMRVIKGTNHWKSLLRPFLYFKYNVYELKKNTV